MDNIKIEIRNLAKVYVQGDTHIHVLDSVDFLIKSGEFISITGRSGSGKSTLLNIVAGLTLPTSGTVFLDENDIFRMNDAELSQYRNARIGYVPQISSVLPNLTILDNVRLPFHLAKREGDSTERAHLLLELVGLDEMANRMPKRLSGGQVKRVAIARALMNKPNFLLADEPTGDLDVQTTKEIMSIFKMIVKEGISVLMVTHDLESAESADRYFTMSCGILTLKAAQKPIKNTDHKFL